MGFKYFRLEKLGDYWNMIASSRTVCIYFPAEFPELRLELYRGQKTNEVTLHAENAPGVG